MENNKTETYTINIKCLNCSNRNPTEIPKGQAIRIYLQDKILICTKCGLKLITH